MEQATAYAEVSLGALSHNLEAARRKSGHGKVIPVVKANAYGHGAVAVARHLAAQGVPKLGVAFTREAVELRESGITIPILIFFDRDSTDAWFDYNLTPVVFDMKTAKRISSEASRRNRQINVHIKVDTGMGRVGLDMTRARDEIARMATLRGIRLEGLMSHFAEADLQDKDFAEYQLKSFSTLVRNLKHRGLRFDCCHMANSAAVLTMPGACFTMVRPGIMLYGYGCRERESLQPVMSIKSRIVFLKKVPAGTSISYSRTFITKRKSVIATIPAGYADGFDRRLSNQGHVLINGKRAPVAGRVCMDTVMVDVTDVPGVNYESEVVILGRQGQEQVTADELAERTGTIPYEVLTSVGQRISRIYRTSPP
ncbi:MAG: alanine racemase [Nitrospiraceae bacterium]|nr:MAG: alanine racemase [Nitrospiraceae bacterium]